MTQFDHLVKKGFVVHDICRAWEPGAITCTCMDPMAGKGPVISSCYDNGYLPNTPVHSHSTIPSWILHPHVHGGCWDHVTKVTVISQPFFFPFVHPNIRFASFWLTWLFNWCDKGFTLGLINCPCIGLLHCQVVKRINYSKLNMLKLGPFSVPVLPLEFSRIIC